MITTVFKKKNQVIRYISTKKQKQMSWNEMDKVVVN